MALDMWRGGQRGVFDPWNSIHREFGRVFDEMDRMMLPFRARAIDEDLTLNPPCDVRETDSAYLIEFDVPGISKDDIEIEAQGNNLIVTGERHQEEEHTGGETYRMERRFGRFRRVFTLPEGTNFEKVEAQYAHGVLQLSVPKAEAAKPRKISIGEAKGGFLKRLTGRNGGKKETEQEPRKAAGT